MQIQFPVLFTQLIFIGFGERLEDNGRRNDCKAVGKNNVQIEYALAPIILQTFQLNITYPLPFPKANRKQANRTEIQTNQSAILS